MIEPFVIFTPPKYAVVLPAPCVVDEVEDKPVEAVSRRTLRINKIKTWLRTI